MTAETHGDGTLRPPADAVLVGGAEIEPGSRVAVVASRYHSEVVQQLLDAACQRVSAEVGAARVDVLFVGGAFELGPAAKAAAASGRYAAVVAVGCVIRGETPHFDHVCAEAARGILLASLETGVPVGFGVITADDAEQAWARAGGEAGNKGAEAADAAVDLARTLAALRAAGTAAGA